MLRRLFIVTFVSAVAILALHLLWTPRSAQTLAAQSGPVLPQVRAFTATRFDATFLPGKGIPVRTEIRTIAVRGDGSRSELFHRRDPSGNGKVLYIKKITDVPGVRRVVVEPRSESITTYPLHEQAIRSLAVKLVTECEGEAAGELLGLPVTVAETTLGPEDLGPGPGLVDEIRTRAWLAPRLNCFPLRRETRFFKDGQEKQLKFESVLAFTEGEPDFWFFEIPAGYVERPPSAAMAEAARRYPNEKSLACGTCSTSRKDEAYFHAQQDNR